ncbi:MAG: SPOR domain-containing protein [Rubrivivax sp.]
MADSTESAAVVAARMRARRRLIGAVVLLAIGVVAFPMLFDTQPRPIAGDIPFQVAQREPDAPPAGSRSATRAVTGEPAATAAASGAVASPAIPSPDATTASRAGEPDKPTAAQPNPQPTVLAPVPQPAPVAAPAQVQPPPLQPTPRNEDGARALALLQGAPTPPVQIAGRHVVQVGAYADAAALRDVRSKVEKLGLKTYTQVIDSKGSRSTRVRVGPFTSRDEADAAAAKLRAAGLPAAVLTL